MNTEFIPKEFTLFDVLNLIDFRFRDDEFGIDDILYENTDTVRIHTEGSHAPYFVFGVNDFDGEKKDIISEVLSPRILGRKVASITSSEMNILTILLEEDKAETGTLREYKE